MSRILLADDSPHAQRMGERILRDEGFEVVSVTDGETAMIRLSDVDPDLVLADAFLPRRSGLEICREVKTNPRFRHVLPFPVGYPSGHYTLRESRTSGMP